MRHEWLHAAIHEIELSELPGGALEKLFNEEAGAVLQKVNPQKLTRRRGN